MIRKTFLNINFFDCRIAEHTDNTMDVFDFHELETLVAECDANINLRDNLTEMVYEAYHRGLDVELRELFRDNHASAEIIIDIMKPIVHMPMFTEMMLDWAIRERPDNGVRMMIANDVHIDRIIEVYTFDEADLQHFSTTPDIIPVLAMNGNIGLSVAIHLYRAGNRRFHWRHYRILEQFPDVELTTSVNDRSMIPDEVVIWHINTGRTLNTSNIDTIIRWHTVVSMNINMNLLDGYSIDMALRLIELNVTDIDALKLISQHSVGAVDVIISLCGLSSHILMNRHLDPAGTVEYLKKIGHLETVLESYEYYMAKLDRRMLEILLEAAPSYRNDIRDALISHDDLNLDEELIADIGEILRKHQANQ